MDYPSLRKLFSRNGQQALQAALSLQPRETDYLPCFTFLSKQYPADITRAALETAILRREATGKFPFADRLYLTRESLEQASNFEISRYRAERYKGYDLLVDLGCSIGGDTIPLSDHAFAVGIDYDPLRLAMARENSAAIGTRHQVEFILADLKVQLPLRLSAKWGLFFDPGRRSGGKRVYSIREYQPELAVVKNWVELTPAIGVKLSPGVNLRELDSYDAEIEFISLHGELKEAILWFGPLKSVHRRATILPGMHTLTAETKRITLAPRLSSPLKWLYEPDPAILRAGLVRELARQLDAAQLDVDIAYLTAENRIESPLARVWQVEAWLPFNLKRLRSILRARKIERVVVKKRGSPIEPEQLIDSLKLKSAVKTSGEERILFLTHLSGSPIVVICLPNL